MDRDVMTDVTDLPETHPWVGTSYNDKLEFVCRFCDVHVPVAASDIQAGIRLYCPECDRQMTYNTDWKDDD